MGNLKLVEPEDLLELSDEYLSDADHSLKQDNMVRDNLACNMSMVAALQSISKHLEGFNNRLDNITAVIE